VRAQAPSLGSQTKAYGRLLAILRAAAPDGVSG